MAGIFCNKFGGFLFLLILMSTAFLGSMLMMGPILPLMFIKPHVFRQINDNLMALWLTLPVLLLELMFGVKCKTTGDKLSKYERSIIIMNHRTRLDWLFFWKPLFSQSSVRSEKIILKDDLKQVPGAGWAMQVACYVFLARKWDKDQAWLTKLLKYYCDLRYCSQFLIYPEGTDFCKPSKVKSDSYADKNGLPRYEYLLHPRTTGFSFIMDTLKKRNMVDAIYDVTIGYPDRIPVRGELDVLCGTLPKEIHFHVKRYPIDSLPSDTDYGKWCAERWQEKEVQLKEFYTQNRTFADSRATGDHPDSTGSTTTEYMALYAALVYWIAFYPLVTCLMLYTSIAWWHMFAVGTFFTLVGLFYGGMEQLMVDAYNWHVGRQQQGNS